MGVTTVWRMRRIATGVLGLALMAAACGGGSEPAAAPSTDLAPTTVALPEDTAGDFDNSTILDGTFTTVDGADFELAALRGQDLVVWFWAPW